MSHDGPWIIEYYIQRWWLAERLPAVVWRPLYPNCALAWALKQTKFLHENKESSTYRMRNTITGDVIMGAVL